MSGFWNYTYCIHCDDLTLIEQTLTCLLEQEGCHRITLPEISIDVEELRHNPWLLSHEVWIFGLFVGSYGWTIAKILPEEILCQRAINADHPRLSALARQIGCDTFYVGLYEYGGILMEADATGDIFISGSIGEEYLQEDKFFDERINSEKFEQFLLLDVSEEIHRAKQVLQEEENKRFEQWEEQFLDDYANSHFSPMIPSALEQWKAQWKTFFKKDKYQLSKEKGGKRLYETLAFEASHLFIESDSEMFEKALAHLLGGTPSYWYLGADPLVYRAYTQQEQLKADGARLLYFRPTQ
ncbi:hypothetical protein [Nostoc sp. LEGE 12450]|uniref:hypothetical protein n=1 Tax=Nostoc sp. LEGE 12450 TaxID=1828643 RepID=UPI001880AE3A|nr:hypothetical protein [Nostoc sp. LEGE 12450]MBE8986315.1 hypothetical protein [Nostoc sp. LEGE 12450]